MSYRKSWSARPLSAALMTAFCGVALAQEQSTAGGLEEVVVTARKRVETTQDVPVAVTSISPAQVERYDLTSLERVAAVTPALMVGRSPSGSGATLVMRGIGSNTTSIGLEQSVAVIVDGAYYGQGRTINEGFFDLARLEILKGPQALFFGKNATAGVVSITTADPSSEFEAIARAGYEFEAKQVLGEAVISGPITDQLGLRLAVRGSDMGDGYYKQLGTDQIYPTSDRTSTSTIVTPTEHTSGPAGDGRSQEFYVRGTMKWQPSDDFTATIKANYGDNSNDNPAAGSVLYNCPTGFSAGNPAIPCARKFQSSANRFPDAIATTVPHANHDGQTGNQYDSWGVNADLSYQLDKGTITSVTNFNENTNVFQFDGDSVSRAGPAGVFATEWSKFNAFSTELRALTSLDGPLNGLLGVYYQKTKRDYLAWTASGGLEDSSATPGYRRYLANSKDSQTDGETVAGFGQIVYTPIEQVEITGGVRYTHETKDSYFVEPYSHPIRVTQGIFKPADTVTSKQSWDNSSPEATIAFKPNSDVNIYAAYKTAYKSGGFSNSGIHSATTTKADFEFDPEEAKGYELGVKSTLLDDQLRLNVDAYTFKYTDLQLDFFRSDIFAFTTINAGSATTKGVELEFEFAPREIEGLNLHGSLNYNEATYGNAPLAPCYAGQTRAAGCNLVYVNDGTANGSSRPFDPATDTVANRQNLKGLSTANAPKWTATLGFNYETAVTSNLLVGFSADARYSDSYLATAFGNPVTEQDSYVNADATLHVGTQDDRWRLALIGKNLTNHWTATGGNDTPNTGSGTGTTSGVLADQTGFSILPRTIQLQATYRY